MALLADGRIFNKDDASHLKTKDTIGEYIQ